MDGDVVLFNRQPSLHKLSIMAHQVWYTNFPHWHTGIHLIQSRCQGRLSSSLEKTPWLRLVTCLLDLLRFQEDDRRGGALFLISTPTGLSGWVRWRQNIDPPFRSFFSGICIRHVTSRNWLPSRGWKREDPGDVVDVLFIYGVWSILSNSSSCRLAWKSRSEFHWSPRMDLARTFLLWSWT